MLRATVLSLLVIAQVCWGASALGAPPVPAGRPLILIPTAFQELNELRVFTGRKAVAHDGTLNAVYVKNTPSTGNTYLNFHVDVASESGPFVLRSSDIRLEGPRTTAIALRGAAKDNPSQATPASTSYTPWDWFLDTGIEEVRGDALTVEDKAIVQFTIEVPLAGFDDLSLFIRSQRVGTVGEIRARIARDRGTE